MTYFSEYAHLYELQATGHRTLHAYQRRSDCQSWRVFSSVCTLEVAYLKLLLTERWNNVSSRGSIKGFQFDYYPNCHLNQTKYLSFSLTLDGAHLMLWCNMCERVVPTVYCSFNAMITANNDRHSTLNLELLCHPKAATRMLTGQLKRRRMYLHLQSRLLVSWSLWSTCQLTMNKRQWCQIYWAVLIKIFNIPEAALHLQLWHSVKQ